MLNLSSDKLIKLEKFRSGCGKGATFAYCITVPLRFVTLCVEGRHASMQIIGDPTQLFVVRCRPGADHIRAFCLTSLLLVRETQLTEILIKNRGNSRQIIVFKYNKNVICNVHTFTHTSEKC